MGKRILDLLEAIILVGLLGPFALLADPQRQK